MVHHRLIAQLFAEGAGPAAGDGAGAQSQNAAEGGNPIAGEKEIKRQKRAGTLENVKYGIQEAQENTAPVAGEQKTDDSRKEQAQETFEDLIKGKYKQEYDSRVQAAIQNRFKNAKAAEDTLSRLAPILQMVGEKYGVDASDIGKMDVAKLTKAMESDDSLFEQEAMERGMSVDVFKQVKSLERENENLRRMEEQRIQETETQRHFANLVRQAEGMKATYPGFDLMAEMQNPDFVRLTRPGTDVDVRTAYEVVHKNEIWSGAMANATRQGAQKVANSVAAQARRPQEPGSDGQGSADIRQDPGKLTRKDMEEIARRVARGEKIRF